MRQGGTLYYLLTDHLGSTALVTNASGGVVGQQRYYPYGAGRPTDTTLPTDYRFTGQRREGTIGLYDYGARFYDPALGRFLSADTVVPQPGNPQALNRYAYVLNNPLRYVDPTGLYGEDAVNAYMERVYGSKWREMKELQNLYMALLAAGPNDIIFAMSAGGDLYGYQVLGTDRGSGEEIWGLDCIGRYDVRGGTFSDPINVFAESRRQKSLRDVDSWSYNIVWQDFIGLFSLDDQAHLVPKLLFGSTEARTVSKAESLLIKAFWTAPLVLIPSPTTLLGKIALSTAKVFGIGVVFGDVFPGPGAAEGNEVIRWQKPWGPASSLTVQYVTIVVSSGSVVQFTLAKVDWSPVMFDIVDHPL